MTTAKDTVSPSPMAVAVWVGLVAAGLELIGVVLKRTMFHQMAFVGRDVWWTLPLVHLCLFGALGLAFTIARRIWSREYWWQASLWGSIFLGSAGVFLTAPRLHRVAVLVLAAGMATQATRFATGRCTGYARLVSRTLPWLLVLAVATGVVVRGNLWWQERQALASLPAAAPQSPNVLVIVLDTVRAASLSLYGYGRQTTPHLEQWAKQGVLFTEAFSTASWTLPSHASLLTGRWEPELSTGWSAPLDKTYPTLPEVLAARGYASAGFIANHGYASMETGIARGFTHFEDYTLTPSLILRSSALGRALGRDQTLRSLVGAVRSFGRKDAPEITGPFLEWTASNQGRPWFALLNYYDAHRPYQPPEPFSSKFASTEVPPDPRFEQHDNPENPWGPEDARRFQVAYDGAIAYLDAELNSLFEAMRRRGDLEKTVIVITSDHGEEFGEHGLWDHGLSLYLASVQVPLIVLAPGLVPAGSVVNTPVSIRDIPATIVDLIDRGRASPFPGQSLARFWRTGGAVDEDVVITGVEFTPGHPAWFPVSKGDVIGLMKGPLRYIRNRGNGSEELFDFRADPDERRDLAKENASQADIAHFRNALEQAPRRSERRR